MHRMHNTFINYRKGLLLTIMVVECHATCVDLKWRSSRGPIASRQQMTDQIGNVNLLPAEVQQYMPVPGWKRSIEHR